MNSRGIQGVYSLPVVEQFYALTTVFICTHVARLSISNPHPKSCSAGFAMTLAGHFFKWQTR
ncbi:hypothetical protein MCEMIEM13_00551 [Comamonadaceae bacterium]